MILKKSQFFTFYDYGLNSEKKNKFFFICDHASNRIPKKYNNLGLSKEILESHIAWDIGAKRLTLKISKALNTKCFTSNFSRLIIDPNRKITDPDLILKKSFENRISANTNLTPELKQKRLKFYNSYHQGLEQVLKENIDKNTILISIHSFTRIFKQSNRSTEIGLLWNKNISTMLEVKNELIKNHINVGNNKPYSGFFYNYTLDRHSKQKLNKNLSIEIRNDLICDKKGIKKWCNAIKNSLMKIK